MPNLARKEYCTGCTACASVCPKGCIAMIPDENGFLCPAVEVANCVECGLCEKCCPVMTPMGAMVSQPKAYAAYSKDDTIRLESSSGGVFTEIALTVLEKGGAVFGAAYNQCFEVNHICVETERDLAKLRGAKYVQSDLRGVFSQVKGRLDRGQQVLFSGTPCQVGGLIAFLQKPYDNLLTVDFVCHSVPSPTAWQEYVKYRAQQDSSGRLPSSINMRSKQTGWTNYQYSNLFQYKDGYSHCEKNSDSLYMKLFLRGCINRKSCSNCQFKGYHRVSDLTIGDFWGVWDIVPEMDDNKGTSLMLIHSVNGQALWKKLQNQVCFKEVSPEQASQQNPAMLVSSQSSPYRFFVMKKIRSGDIGSFAALILPQNQSLVSRIKQKAAYLLSKL